MYSLLFQGELVMILAYFIPHARPLSYTMEWTIFWKSILYVMQLYFHKIFLQLNNVITNCGYHGYTMNFSWKQMRLKVKTNNDSPKIFSSRCELLLLQLSTLVKEIALASGQFVMMTTFRRAAGTFRDLGTVPTKF